MSEDPERVANPAPATQRDKPVTFRELFSVREYRALYASLIVNLLGDYLARAAITVLVYQQSNSVLLSAAAFGVSFLPWIIGGTLLAALAERYPYRRVLILADLVRMALIAVLLIPHLPTPVMLLLVLLAGFGTPPAQAARSALMPLVVGRDKLSIALATNATTNQASQVFGYLVGATLAVALSPRIALAIDVATFAVSAVVLAVGVRPRPPAHERTKRTHLLRETAEGFRLVFGKETLRSIALVMFVLTMFAIVPEGLAAAWAAEGNSDSTTQGVDQGLIMAAGPIGFVVGGILINRLFGTARRNQLIRPLAVLSALILVPALTGPPAPIAAILVALSGICQGGLSPTLNSKFALILPHGFRARAYGVMQTGMQLSQFAAVMVTGLLADRFWLPMVVGLWSIGGAVVMGLLALRWPSDAQFAADTEEAAAAQPPDDPAPVAPAPPSAPPPPQVTRSTASVTPERS